MLRVSRVTITPRLMLAKQTRSPMSMLWRCGGRTCPPGTCDHDDEVRRHAAGTAPGIAPQIVRQVLQSPGSPLPTSARRDAEQRLGHDFGNVHVHADARAVESARAVGAHAYTVGNHVVFGAGRFAPSTSSGRHLLLHELVHTVQQAGSGAEVARSSLHISTPADPAEHEAERIATAALHGEELSRFPATASPFLAQPHGQLQRQADISQAPPGLPCILATGAGHLAGSNVMFDISSSILTGPGRAAVAAFASRWVADGSRDDVMVDGWASSDGAQSLNWRLSCDRAEAVKAELIARGVPSARITTLAHGESTEFSAGDLTANRRAVITRLPRLAPPPPAPTPPAPTPPAPAPPVETITSETVLTSPRPRTRKNIGVGEEVRLTHAPGAAAWATTAGTLSAANGVTVTLTAPDTAQRVTVTGGGTTIIFDVLAPTDVHMDRFGATGVKHTQNHADSGIETQPFLLPDTVNFRNVIYHELNVAAVVTSPGAYSCFAGGVGHCRAAAGGVCQDLAMTNTVVAGKGTQAVLTDCVYSGDCQQAAPFVPGSITFSIGYEYKVGAGPFHNIRTVDQQSTLALGVILTSSKAGANGVTTVASPTVAIADCP